MPASAKKDHAKEKLAALGLWGSHLSRYHPLIFSSPAHEILEMAIMLVDLHQIVSELSTVISWLQDLFAQVSLPQLAVLR